MMRVVEAGISQLWFPVVTSLLCATLAWFCRPRRGSAPLFTVISDAHWKDLFSTLREDAFAGTVLAERSRTVLLGSTTATSDPVAVRALLLSRPHSLGRSWVYRALAKFMPSSDGILFMEGEGWRKRHSAFTPLLTGGNVRRYSLAMFESSLGALSDYVFARQRSPNTGDGRHHQAPALQRLPGHDLLTAVREGASRFLLRFAFGVDPNGSEGQALEADMDLYARTAFEVFPFASPLSQLRAYVTLVRASRRIGASVRTIIDRGLYCNDYSNAGYGAAASEGKLPTLLARMLSEPAHAASSGDKHDAGSTPGQGPAAGRLAPASKTPEFSINEVVSEVNHLHGAHKAVAFVTTCALAELSLPNPAAQAARRALINELVAVCGRPPLQMLADACKIQSYDVLLQEAVGSPAAFGRLLGVGAPPPSALPPGWRPPDRSDLTEGRLPVLSRVWRETLRHHVVSMGVLRKTAGGANGARHDENQDTGEGVASRGNEENDGCATIHGAKLPPGTDVVLLLHALHHDPQLWGPDAHQWLPDRWAAIDASRERSAKAAPADGDASKVLPDPLQPLPFYPFLEGVRRCAGMHLAELQAAVMLYVWLVIGDVRVEGVPTEIGSAPDSRCVDANAFGMGPLEAAGDPTRGRIALQRAPALLSALPTAAETCQAVIGPRASAPVRPSTVAAPPSSYAKLVKRPDMFASLDGRLPFTVAGWESGSDCSCVN